MLYPEKEFKKIEMVNHNYHLCRWTFPDINIKGEDDKLNTEAFDHKSIPGFSTNIIPESEIDDCYIEFISKELTTKYTANWNEGDSPVLVNENEFIQNTKRGYFLVMIKDINEHEDDYDFPPLPDPKSTKFKFKVLVKHAPLVSNYFHFELEVVDTRTGAIITKIEKPWQKLISHSIKTQLCRVAKFSISSF
jgi:hypothetical protein